jgi:hypothetical protein
MDRHRPRSPDEAPNSVAPVVPSQEVVVRVVLLKSLGSVSHVGQPWTGSDTHATSCYPHQACALIPQRCARVGICGAEGSWDEGRKGTGGQSNTVPPPPSDDRLQFGVHCQPIADQEGDSRHRVESRNIFAKVDVLTCGLAIVF